MRTYLILAISLTCGIAHAQERVGCPTFLEGAPIKTSSINAPGFINGPPDREVASTSMVTQFWELTSEDAQKGTYICVYENGRRFEQPIPMSSRGCKRTLKHKGRADYEIVAFNCG